MFWRDMGWKEEEEAVEARDGVCNMTDIVCLLQFGRDKVQAHMPVETQIGLRYYSRTELMLLSCPRQSKACQFVLTVSRDRIRWW